MNRRKALLSKSNAIRSLLKTFRKRRANYKALNEGAAIDIASILIGVMVLSLIGALIATTVFVVIPWAQDEAAKNQLKSIMSAQQAYAGIKATESASGQQIGSLYAAKMLSTSTNGPDPTTLAKDYGDLTDLIEADMFDPSFLPDDATDEVYGEQMLSRDKSLCVVKLDGGAGYEAAVMSASGNVFVTNDNWVGPFKVPETAPVCLGRVLGEYVDSEGKVIIPPTVTPIEELDPNAPATNEIPIDETGGAVDDDEHTAPEPSPTSTPTQTPSATPTPTATATPSPTPQPVTPEQAPEPPAENKDPKTKKFMFCHKGAMHSNSFNGMVNGHHGHSEDIMPPIPFKNYVGWNWNAQTAKIYYNNCQPV